MKNYLHLATGPAPMTKDEAVNIYESGQWQQWDDVEKVRRQLFEERLMMPFAEFQGAVERVLGQSYTTIAFGMDSMVERMKADFLALHPAA